jgi:hypothetical protein
LHRTISDVIVTVRFNSSRIKFAFTNEGLLQVYKQHQGFNVADETANIKAEEFQFYNFEINPDIATAQLTGSYEEKDGNDVAVTVYEISSCNAPASSADFDISTCKEIHTETGPSGSLHLPLSPGKYYLNFASPDQSNNLKVNVHFDVVNEG